MVEVAPETKRRMKRTIRRKCGGTVEAKAAKVNRVLLWRARDRKGSQAHNVSTIKTLLRRDCDSPGLGGTPPAPSAVSCFCRSPLWRFSEEEGPAQAS